MTRSFRAKGFSLVELLVSILIGLIILAGVVQVVVSSKNTFINQEEMSFIQENARYAFKVLSTDFKEAGYLGCAGNQSSVAMVAANMADVQDIYAYEEAGGDLSFRPFTGFESKPNGVTQNTFTTNTFPNELVQRNGSTADRKYLWSGDNGEADNDAIVIRKLSGRPFSLTLHAGASLSVQGAEDEEFPAGSLVGVVSDQCNAVSLARVAADSTATTINLGGGANCGGNLSIQSNSQAPVACKADCSCNAQLSPKRFRAGATVYHYESVVYYIGESSVIEGEPALKRASVRNGDLNEEEIALGVEGINVIYSERSVDATTGASMITFRDADKVTDWSQVVSAELTLTFRSQSKLASFDGSGPEYLTQEITSLFNFRNI